MKVVKIIISAAAVAMLAPLSAMGAAGDGIVGSPHDFVGKTQNATAIGVCTFCHTPHKASQTALLWNHTASANATFSWDVATTTGGTNYATFANTYEGSTTKCLACHDGSVAIGDVNWFRGQSWNGANALNLEKVAEGDVKSVGYGGDLSGNHPVAMPYPYANQANTYNAITSGDGLAFDEWIANPVTLGIRLFSDTGTEISAIDSSHVGTDVGIECSSCHDPHNKKATGEFFLLGSLTGNDTNYICMKCHVK